MRPIIIDESPGTNDPLHPLDPQTNSGSRLQKLVEPLNLVRDFVLMNLFDDEPRIWSVSNARRVASLRRPLLAERLVIVCGSRVANAFDVPSHTHAFCWTWMSDRRALPHGFWIAKIPHSNSPKQQWNKKHCHRDMSAFFSMIPESMARPRQEIAECGTLITGTSIAELYTRIAERPLASLPFWNLHEYACFVWDDRRHDKHELDGRSAIQQRAPLH